MRTDSENEYLIKAFDASDNRLIIISHEFEILATNRFTGELQKDDIVGQQCFRVLCDRKVPCIDCPAVKVLKTHKPALGLKQIGSQTPNEPYRLYSYPIFSGETIDALVVMRFDRPAREEIEEELERSNAFLRNLILSSVDGVIAADRTGKILIFNDAASEISGYSVDEALDHLNIRDVYPEDGARDIMRKLRSDDYGDKGKLMSYHVDVLRKDDKIIPISLDAAIVYEGDKEVATIGFFHDLREKLRMKAELEKVQVQLLQAEKMASLGKLAAGVAHQLNNPIGGITLFAKLILEEYDLADGAKDDLNRILQDAKRCKDTVKELLEFARQTNHQVQPHDINQAISRTMFLLENQTLFQNIEIEKNLADDLPFVPADIQKLNHLFMNIILNAAQAMKGNGKLILKTDSSPKKDGVCIKISDTGPGIPKDILPQIFDPFFTTKDEGKGTGLGLSIVYGIVEDHGGEITAQSKPGEGTTFMIKLPLAKKGHEGGKSGKST
jgi:two-component system NtrC family sensor kinase